MPAGTSKWMHRALTTTIDLLLGTLASARGDILTAENDSLAADLQRQIEAAGGEDPRALMRHIQPAMQNARANALAAIERMRAVLTDEQWENMPAAIREYGGEAEGEGPDRESGRGVRLSTGPWSHSLPLLRCGSTLPEDPDG
jgi:hypothetical protein